jgi:hypothetical protein
MSWNTKNNPYETRYGVSRECPFEVYPNEAMTAAGGLRPVRFLAQCREADICLTGNSGRIRNGGFGVSMSLPGQAELASFHRTRVTGSISSTVTFATNRFPLNQNSPATPTFGSIAASRVYH